MAGSVSRQCIGCAFLLPFFWEGYPRFVGNVFGNVVW
jgi:hypothetical protein